ncbi:phosphotransferase [Bifidobacterium simiarum]|nr:phosphotransferase [Bifidobacterium simiarum]
MSERSVFTLAALASAAMPNLTVAGTRSSEQIAPTDAQYGIDTAVVTDTTGREFDVSASDTPKGRQRLASRADASAALLRAKEPAGLGFALERVAAFQPGEYEKGPTGNTAVLVTVHNDGFATPLDQLTESQCVSVGTAIGAIHRLRPGFMAKEGYPSYAPEQIKQQLEAWIARLKEAGHVPQEITDSWERIVTTEGLWSFRTCPVHGGFSDGDMLFSSTGLNAMYRWGDMQVNDPARDLAWIFDRLDAKRRNNVLSAYARIIGSRLDDLIMLRASLWLQMEQVGEFIKALDRADNDRIIEFKAHVERLAHQLSVRASRMASPPASAKGTPGNPSTITVENLLSQDGQRTARPRPAAADAGGRTRPTGVPSVHMAVPNVASRSTAERSVTERVTAAAGQSTANGPSISHADSKTLVVENMGISGDDTATVSLPALSPEDFDDDGVITGAAGRIVGKPSAMPDDSAAPGSSAPGSATQGESTPTGGGTASGAVPVPPAADDDGDAGDDATAGVGIERAQGRPTGYVSLVDGGATDGAPADSTPDSPTIAAQSEEPADGDGERS